MKYTVVGVAVLKDIFNRKVEDLDFEPVVEHVEADNVQEAEFEAAALHRSIVPNKRLRILAVFDQHLIELKSAGLDSTS